MSLTQGTVQYTNVNSGASPSVSLGKQADLLVSETHGRFYTETYNNNVYSTGMQLTSISNATFTTADGLSGTLGTAATATPIIGLWNASSSFNAEILQATMGVVVTTLQATGCGGFVWAVFTGNTTNNITVASQAVPVNRKTLLASGSQMKGLSGLALTGLASVGTFLGASSLCGGSAINAAELQTAVGFLAQQEASTENIDGSIIVPPGGILGLFCSTTPVAHSAVSSISWIEIPV